MTPTYNPTITTMKENKGHRSAMNGSVTQVWKKSGRCPEGTIPVRRIRTRSLLKATSVEGYGRKEHRCAHHAKNLKVQLENHSVRIQCIYNAFGEYLNVAGNV